MQYHPATVCASAMGLTTICIVMTIFLALTQADYKDSTKRKPVASVVNKIQSDVFRNEEIIFLDNKPYEFSKLLTMFDKIHKEPELYFNHQLHNVEEYFRSGYRGDYSLILNGHILTIRDIGKLFRAREVKALEPSKISLNGNTFTIKDIIKYYANEMNIKISYKNGLEEIYYNSQPIEAIDLFKIIFASKNYIFDHTRLIVENMNINYSNIINMLALVPGLKIYYRMNYLSMDDFIKKISGQFLGKFEISLNDNILSIDDIVNIITSYTVVGSIRTNQFIFESSDILESLREVDGLQIYEPDNHITHEIKFYNIAPSVFQLIMNGKVLEIKDIIELLETEGTLFYIDVGFLDRVKGVSIYYNSTEYSVDNFKLIQQNSKVIYKIIINGQFVNHMEVAVYIRNRHNYVTYNLPQYLQTGKYYEEPNSNGIRHNEKYTHLQPEFDFNRGTVRNFNIKYEDSTDSGKDLQSTSLYHHLDHTHLSFPTNPASDTSKIHHNSENGELPPIEEPTIHLPTIEKLHPNWEQEINAGMNINHPTIEIPNVDPTWEQGFNVDRPAIVIPDFDQFGADSSSSGMDANLNQNNRDKGIEHFPIFNPDFDQFGSGSYEMHPKFPNPNWEQELENPELNYNQINPNFEQFGTNLGSSQMHPNPNLEQNPETHQSITNPNFDQYEMHHRLRIPNWNKGLSNPRLDYNQIEAGVHQPIINPNFNQFGSSEMHPKFSKPNWKQNLENPELNNNQINSGVHQPGFEQFNPDLDSSINPNWEQKNPTIKFQQKLDPNYENEITLLNYYPLEENSDSKIIQFAHRGSNRFPNNQDNSNQIEPGTDINIPNIDPNLYPNLETFNNTLNKLVNNDEHINWSKLFDSKNIDLYAKWMASLVGNISEQDRVKFNIKINPKIYDAIQQFLSKYVKRGQLDNPSDPSYQSTRKPKTTTIPIESDPKIPGNSRWNGKIPNSFYPKYPTIDELASNGNPGLHYFNGFLPVIGSAPTIIINYTKDKKKGCNDAATTTKEGLDQIPNSKVVSARPYEPTSMELTPEITTEEGTTTVDTNDESTTIFSSTIETTTEFYPIAVSSKTSSEEETTTETTTKTTNNLTINGAFNNSVVIDNDSSKSDSSTDSMELTTESDEVTTESVYNPSGEIDFSSTDDSVSDLSLPTSTTEESTEIPDSVLYNIKLSNPTTTSSESTETTSTTQSISNTYKLIQSMANQKKHKYLIKYRNKFFKPAVFLKAFKNMPNNFEVIMDGHSINLEEVELQSQYESIVFPDVIVGDKRYTAQDIIKSLAEDNVFDITIKHEGNSYTPKNFLMKFKKIPINFELTIKGNNISPNEVVRYIYAGKMFMNDKLSYQSLGRLRNIFPTFQQFYTYISNKHLLTNKVEYHGHSFLVKTLINKYFKTSTNNIASSVEFPSIKYKGHNYSAKDIIKSLVHKNQYHLMVRYNDKNYTPAVFWKSFKQHIPMQFNLILKGEVLPAARLLKYLIPSIKA